MKKILINLVTTPESANLMPTILKCLYYQKQGLTIVICSSTKVKNKINRLNPNSNFNFLIIKNTREAFTKTEFLKESLKRNIKIIGLLNFIKFQKYDYVYSLSVLDLCILPFALKLVDKHIKWVAVFDNIVPLNDPGPKLIRFLAWLFFHISLLLLKKTDNIFAISPELKNYLIIHGFNLNKITITGNAIEGDLIKKTIAPNTLKYDSIYVGRINETKGIFDMLDVVSKTKVEYPEFKLAIIGKGDKPTETKFRHRIKQMRLTKNIILLGFIDGIEKFKLIKSSKTFIFLSKSKSESFGVALLEAVCCGLKAFAYDLPAYNNIYKNNEIYRFQISDTNSVARVLIKTLKSGDYHNIIGKKMIDKYSWKHIAALEYRTLVNIL